jgi:hypothetical protein
VREGIPSCTLFIMESITDQRHYEPQSVAQLQIEFPVWEVFRGVNRLYYARLPRTSPPVLLRGEDLLDLRDEIIKWLRMHTTEETGR